MNTPDAATLRLLQQRWLAASDWQALHEAIGELYDHGIDAETFAQSSFRALGKLIRHDLPAFGELNHATQQLNVIVPANAPSEIPRALEGFARHHRRYELFNFDPNVQGGRPFMRADWFSQRQFRDTDVHAEAFSVIGMDDHLAASIGGTGEAVFIGLLRRSGGGNDYDERDRTLFATLQPHLRRAWQLTRWRGIFSHQTPLSPEILRGVLGITRRQAEILAWVADGKTNREIAVIAGLSEGTVKLHLANLFQRLGVETRVGAVRAAWCAVANVQSASGAAIPLRALSARSCAANTSDP